jgi:aspartyl-tRNA(Asn)/glutamyl-tRNA(Gln) amidotransferase subunit A
MSVPCGFSRQGLPIGLQLTGSYFAETALMRVAWNFERTAGIRDRKPDL